MSHCACLCSHCNSNQFSTDGNQAELQKDLLHEHGVRQPRQFKAVHVYHMVCAKAKCSIPLQFIQDDATLQTAAYRQARCVHTVHVAPCQKGKC